MPTINPTLVHLFANNETRHIFKAVAKVGSVSLKDLAANLHIEKARASQSLDRLREAKLILEQAAPIADFNIYYVTAGGLAAERELRHLESLEATAPNPPE